MPKYELFTTAEVPDFDSLRSYVGRSDSVCISRSPYQGMFAFDPTDTTSADNGGTIIVASNGKRWKRVIDGHVSVLWFGAEADNATDDAAAVQAAQDAMTAKETLEFGAGTHKLKASSVSPYYFGNLVGNLLYPAVMLDKSDATLRGGRAHIVSRSGVASSDVQPAFATNKNMTVGDIENLVFDGVEVDVNNDGDVANTNQRGIYAVGVRGLAYKNTRGISTGGRRGYFSHIQNCHNVQVTGHYHRTVTGGINFRYCDGVILTDSIFDDFSEAVDFDGVSWNAAATNLIFRGTARTSQCLDLNSLQRATISGVIAENTGNVAQLSYKNTTPPNYADYVNVVAPTSLTPTADVTVRGVKAKSIGGVSGSLPLIIGNDFATSSHAGYDPVHHLLLDDWSMEDCALVQMWEGRKVTFQNFSMRNVTGVPVGFAAIDTRSFAGDSDQMAWSDLDVTMRGVSVEQCNRGAARFNIPRRVYIDDLRTENTDTDASGDRDLLFLTLEKRGALVVIDGLDTDRDVFLSGSVAGIPAWAGTTAYPKNQVVSNGGKYYRCTTGGTSAGAGGPSTTARAITDGTCVWRWMPLPFEVVWGRRNKVGGQLVLAGDVHQYIQGETQPIQLGDIAATGTVSKMLFVAKRRCYVARATYSVAATFAADAVNYRALTIKSVQAGAAATAVAQINTQAGWNAYAAVDGGFVAQETGAYLDPGDSMFIDLTSAGAGKALTGLMVALEVLEC